MLDWFAQSRFWKVHENYHSEFPASESKLYNFYSAISAAISTYVVNGGKAIWLYLNPSEYGYIWLVLQVPLVFIYQVHHSFIHAYLVKWRYVK